MDDKKDYSLSFIRFIATIMIVCCHIFQQYDIWLAQFFNVGVQIFLFISGYLHSTKRDNRLSFFLRKVKRLLVEYYVFLIPVLVFIFCINRINLEIKDAVNLVALSGTVHELGHLWFVPTILVCYLLTPLFWDILDSYTKNIQLLKFLIINTIIFIFFHMILKSTINPAWISCYLCGMIAKKFGGGGEGKRIYALKWGLFGSTILYLVIRMCYAVNVIPNINKVESILFVVFNYGHVLLSIVIVYMLKKIWSPKAIVRNKYVKNFLNLSDRYSYDVYLVHHILVLGTYSVFNFIDNIVIGLLIATTITIIWAIIINLLSALIGNRCQINRNHLGSDTQKI